MILPTQGYQELPSGGLRALLRQFGSEDRFGNPAQAKTGRILLQTPQDKEGAIYINKGCIYAVTFTNFVPPIASRLYSGGFINEEQYRYLAQFPSEQVGELVVTHKYTNKEILDNINRQMILSSLIYLYAWKDARWIWEDDAVFTDFTIPSLETMLLLAATDERMGQWEALSRNFPQVIKANAIPLPGPDWDQKERIDSSPEMSRITSMIDGVNSVAKIANVCGFTRFEIAGRLAKATADGILSIPDPEGKDKEALPMNEQDQVELNKALLAVDLARANLFSAEKSLEEIQFRLGKSF